MALVISISSGEETDECITIEQPRKKRKIIESESVVCLDDEEKYSEQRITDNIVIEHDDDESECVTKTIHIESILNNKSIDDTNVIDTSNQAKHNTEMNELNKIDNHTSVPSDIDLHKHKLVDDMEIQNDIVEMFTDCKEMQMFINLCLLQIHNPDTKNLFKSKIPLCKKLYDKAGTEYVQSESFRAFLQEKIVLSKKSSMMAISSFNDIYQNLKSHVHSENIDETSSKHKIIIAKLEHTFRKIEKEIKKLEMVEVNFDEEEDSSYIKLQRYKERAVKVYEKICKYKKEDIHANNALYRRLNFSGSNYSEFNHAINKKFKNNLTFPTYYDVERCLKKTAKSKNLNISESRVKEEARECFKKLGNLLQKRRKADLLTVHSQYLIDNNDPAVENSELELTLKTNYKAANSKINEICEKYTKLQDRGEEPKLSSDSDDSKKESTEDEDDD